MDVIKYLFSALLIISLPGKAQQLPDSLKVNLPDTSLSAENTLFLVEKSSDVYPEIFSGRPDGGMGRIYIDHNNFALRGVEFEVDPQTISSVANSMVLRKPRKVNVRPLSASYMVQYKEEGYLYHISMIRADNNFRIRLRKKLFGNEYRTVSEMAVTALQTEEAERFKFREIVNPKDIFSDMLGGYDPDFWGLYNYIIPDESLEEALIRVSPLIDGQPVQ